MRSNFSFALLLAALLAGAVFPSSICISGSELSGVQKSLTFSYSFSCPSGALKITVLDSTRQPVAGARIGLLDQSPPINETEYAIADSSGSATFLVPDGGDYFALTQEFGACPGDGRFLPNLPSCTAPPPILNNSNSSINATPAIPPAPPPTRPNTVLAKPMPLPKPGAAIQQASMNALDALASAQKMISSAVSALGNKPSEKVGAALAAFRGAQEQYARGNYNESISLANSAAELAKEAYAPKNTSASASNPSSSGYAQYSGNDVPSLLFWGGMALLALIVAYALYSLMPKGALD